MCLLFSPLDSIACYIFTKIVRPLVHYWRARGLRILVYLDDGLCAVSGKQLAIEASQLVQLTLDESGFVTHPTKSIWQPSQRLIWLGFVVDVGIGQIEVPIEKIETLRSAIQQVSHATHICASKLASIVGHIISLDLAFGQVSRFMTQCLYAVLESRIAWCDVLTLSHEASKELEFWSCGHTPSAVRVVYSDASETGYGGYVVEHGASVSYGHWTPVQAVRSSTWRELAAVWFVLLFVANSLTNHCVHWFTDNQNVVRILQVGSKMPDLHVVALKISPCVFTIRYS